MDAMIVEPKTKDELVEEMRLLLDKLDILHEVIETLIKDKKVPKEQIEILRLVEQDFEKELLATTGQLCAMHPLSLP